MSAFGGPNIIEDGLVLYLDAGNRKSYPGSGTTWFDKSGRGNNGTLINGPTFNTGSLGSVVFDGTNDFVNLGDIFNFEYTSIFTLSIIFKPPLLNAYRPLISKRFFQTPFNGWEFATGPIFDRTQLYFFLGAINDNQSLEVYTTDAGINNVGIFVVDLTYDGSSNSNGFKFFVNGIAKNTVSIKNNPIGNPTTTSNLNLARRDLSTFFQFCTIYNLKIYNRALSAQEVLQNFNATKGRFGLV